MKKIKHIFFDLDHTLWDFEKNSALTFQQIFKEETITLSFDAFISIYKDINLKYWKMYREEKVSKEDLRYLRLKETFDSLAYSISDALIDKIAINYIDFLPKYDHVFEGTYELLDYLKGRYELHIITNGFKEVQSKKMESSGLIKYFDKIITSESVNVKKPNPKIFQHALEITGAHVNNAIMIGDSVEADIVGAMDLGMHAIHCNFDNMPLTEPNFISVTSLHDIKNHL